MWLEEGEEFRRGFGTIVREGERLAFEATPRPRAERGRALVERIAGEAVAYRATSYEDLGQGNEEAADGRPREPEIPPDVEAEVVGAFIERHYRQWLDEPVPALGGRTSREAALLKSARPKLVSLLKEMENTSARERRTGRPAYDFGWMGGDLGLDRPG